MSQLFSFLNRRKAEADDLSRTGRPAILAQPVYPFPAVRPLSRLGGQPDLPDDVAWPEGEDGVPLHFLAQIDCSALPANAHLPKAGMLFFFARIDDTMNWADGQADQDQVRVIHAPSPGTQARAVPDRLPALEGGYHRRDREWRRPDEPHSHSYPAWPLVFAAMTSLPQADWQSPKGYEEAQRQFMSREIARARGWPVAGPARPESAEVLNDPAFPGSWRLVDCVARAVLGVTGPHSSIAYAHRDRPEAVADIVARAEQWIADARQHPIDHVPGVDAAGAFVDWLQAICTLPRGEGTISTALHMAMFRLIQAAAHSDAIAARVPDRWLADFDPFAARGRRADPADEPRYPRPYHQLLGFEDSSQDQHPIDSGDILLFTLQSDPAVDFMFCDMGEICFWIPEADLTAGRFDAVFATAYG